MKVTEMLQLVTVEPVLFLYMAVILLEATALRSLINVKACLGVYSLYDCSNHSFLTSADVVGIANQWNKYYESILFFCTLAVSFYVASWSDYLGRKIIMLIPSVGTVIASLVNTMLSIFIETDVSYFFISATVSGLTFGTVGVIASTFGYVSDVVPKESRTKRILILEGMIFAGSAIGVRVCGAILHDANLDVLYNRYALVFTVEAALALIIVIYVMLRLPYSTETVEPTVFENFSCKTLFSLEHLAKVKQTLFKSRLDDGRMKVHLLILALIFIYFGTVAQFTLTYFFTEDKFGWDITKFSNFNSAQLAIEGVGLLVGLPVIFWCLTVDDYIIATVGVCSRILGLVMLGLSSSGVMMYSSACLNVLSEFPVPVVRSVLSKLVDEDERGKIFAFTTIVQNLCFFLGALIFPTIYHVSRSFFHGLCFELLAILQMIAVVVFCFLYSRKSDVITVYESFENEDGSVTETCEAVEKEMLQPT